MKKLLYLIVLLPIMVIGQTQTENYIKTTNYKVATTIVPSPTAVQKQVNVTYVDGLGRPIQQVANIQSNSGKDVVTHIEYDNFGRQVKEYLPYKSNNTNMAFVSSAQSETLTYYASTNSSVTGNPNFDTTTSPYSEKQMESSPLNRVFKQAAPGNPWVMGSGKEIKMDYQTNTTNEVKIYKALATWNATNGVFDISFSQTGGSNYTAGQLYKIITKDEHWTSGTNNTTEEFKDKEGKTILKRTYGYSVVNNVDVNTIHDTYYVYDQYGNLTYVLPPLAEGGTGSATLEGLCYQYKYDVRNRLVEKKLPGKQWEFIIYDKLDRVVATGPAQSPFTNSAANSYVWLTTKYDTFNRPVYTGWCTESTAFSSALRGSRQATITALTDLHETKVTTGTFEGVNIKYSDNVVLFPGHFKLLTVNYYDDYDFLNGPVSFTTVETQAVFYNNSTNKPKGLPTGTWTRIVEASTTTPVKAETTYILYDYKARPIRNYTKNYLGGFTQVDHKYDFVKTLLTRTVHCRLSGGTQVITTDEFAYNDQDKLYTHTHQIDALPKQLMVKNEYDELGQLIVKRVGGTDITTYAGLQKVDYAYNVRGWLTQINKVTGSTYPLQQGSDPVDLFAFKINYNTVENETNATGPGAYSGVALYNGNISETYWRTNNDNILRKYGYKYDDMNRLKNAIYQKPDQANAVTDSYNENMTYDKNGNIKDLKRYGDFDDPVSTMQIDNLGYSYPADSNRLMKVTDTTNNTGGFKDDSSGGNDANDDYVYDANGNMISDENKGITNVSYNHLNLPIEIVFTGTNKKINYLYTATGVKVEKRVSQGSSLLITDYLHGFQYLKGSGSVLLQFFPHAEGYVSNTFSRNQNNYKYVFNYTDHLGNNRLSYTWDVPSEALVILEENNYYPYGLKHNNYNWDQAYFEGVASGEIIIQLVPEVPYKYKFNGKELQNELGLNMYDYGARNYDPALGRWMNIDPLAEKNRRFNPYTYCLNNPVYFIDPDGMEAAAVFTDYEYAPDGKITEIDNEHKNDKTDRLIAQNGDIIADNIDKRILKDGINISRDGLTLFGNRNLQDQVGKLMIRLSVYIQKEISWGFYQQGGKGSGIIDILPYAGNKIDECQPPKGGYFYNGVNYALSLSNHTHPGLWERTIRGELIKGGGSSTPSSPHDYMNVSYSKSGGLLWSRYGVSWYNQDGPLSSKNSPNGMIMDYTKNNTVLDREYLKNTLKWKKDFSSPPKQ